MVAYNGYLVVMRDFFNTQEVGGGDDGLQSSDVHGSVRLSSSCSSTKPHAHGKR